MKYQIHNIQLIEGLPQQNSFETEVSKKKVLLEKVLRNYEKHLVLKLYISRTSTYLFKISVSLKLKGKLLYIEDKGKNATNLACDLLDKLTNTVKKQIVKEKKERLFKRKHRRKESFAEHIQTLHNHYLQNDKEQFDHLIKELLPALNTYILRYLKTKGSGIKINLSINEILDEIYINLYEQFDKLPVNTDDAISWIYGTAREYLEKILAQNNHEREKIDISRLAAEEIKSLEEKFTADAEGELMMYDELDDISYIKKSYGPEILPEDAFVEYPDTELLTEDIKKALEKFN